MKVPFNDLTSARVLVDSINKAKVRLTTIEVVFPRFILAEFNTHRAFSRNSASSRAIPVQRQLEMIEQNPFVPMRFPKNQKGMSADEYWVPGDFEYDQAVDIWIQARDAAVSQVKLLLQLGVHKQIANRLLEPFMWHTVIVSATEWDNFWKLRIDPAAQPEMHRAAEVMKQAYDASKPQRLYRGEWHLPLLDFEEDNRIPAEERIKVAIGRCARVSYLTHDGQRDPFADIDLYMRLRTGGHLSPFEHVAQATDGITGTGNFRGFRQARWFIETGKEFDWVKPLRQRKIKRNTPLMTWGGGGSGGNSYTYHPTSWYSMPTITSQVINPKQMIITNIA